MTVLIHALGRAPALALAPATSDARTRRVAALGVLAAAALAVPGGIEAALGALADAWLAVSVFVAGTIALLLAAERALGADLGTLLDRHARLHVPVGALLGAFPGCGGAIVAVTQFTRGHLSFGGVVATLIATTGDAMFLLIAQAPLAATTVLGVGVATGIATGYAVDALHGPGFLRPRAAARAVATMGAATAAPARAHWSERTWLALAVPGFVLGLLGAFQVDVDALLPGRPAHWLGIAGAALAVAMWAARGGGPSPGGASACGASPSPVRRVVDDTNFVTAWVVFSFAGYELLVSGAGLDVGAAVAGWGALVPLAAVLVGFVPGCGPQIVVTSLYLSGSVPMSAQIGNAIANDGDALFPALAAAPRAALVATAYSAVPAVGVAYAWYAWLEGGL